MAQIRKRGKKLLLLLMLLSVSARVFTGASEAQVNFTSLIIDQNISVIDHSDHNEIVHDEVIVNGSSAKSLPDKHRTYATYKKYLTPDKGFSIDFVSHEVHIAGEVLHLSNTTFVPQSGLLLPRSHAPPVIA